MKKHVSQSTDDNTHDTVRNDIQHNTERRWDNETARPTLDKRKGPIQDRKSTLNRSQKEIPEISEGKEGVSDVHPERNAQVEVTTHQRIVENNAESSTNSGNNNMKEDHSLI